MLTHFLRSTHAGATAITAAVVTVMVVGTAGLIIDHNLLIASRDRLKAASDAAALAATQRLERVSATASDEAVEQALLPIAERYVRLNLMANDPNLRPEDIVVMLAIDRDAGTVDVTSEAPLGASLTGLVSGYHELERIASASTVEQGIRPMVVVLALDVSGSMLNALDGGRAANPALQRIGIVREAAQTLVRILGPNPREPVAIGLVPWSNRICPGEFCFGRYAGSGVKLPTTSASSIASDIRAISTHWMASTATALGIERAHRFAMDYAGEELHRAIVVLTDGQTNHCGWDRVEEGRLIPTGCLGTAAEEAQARACQHAKADGVEVFVIAAMSPENVSGELARQLRACATTDSEPHVFINNTDEDDLHAAFSSIGNQLRVARRVY